LSFNSNMVRLKVDSASARNLHPCSFNSNMVRLKEKRLRGGYAALASFNSNMVRLKAVHKDKKECAKSEV